MHKARKRVMRIIALGHQDEVGKDMFSTFLLTQLRVLGYRAEDVGFADPLKEVCHHLYSWAGLQTRQFYEFEKGRKNIVLLKLGKSPRQIWIDVAEKLREYDKDVFCNCALNGREKTDFLIVRDLRKSVEVETIRSLDTRPLFVRLERNGANNNHYDLEHFHYDLVLDNNGTTRQLNDKAVKLAQSLVKGSV